MDTDVLVIGAGPTGLMLAVQLARRGVRVQIIDRAAGPVRETRALGVQARTLEIYRGLGLAQSAMELGKPGTGANLWSDGEHKGKVPFGSAGVGLTPYPYILVLGQDDNERLLGERLRAEGVTINWNTELSGLEDADGHCTARLRDGEGREVMLTARYVAGCDGARSTLRGLRGIAFPGAPYEQVFYVADLECSGDMVPGEVNVHLRRAGFHLFFPMRDAGHWRLVGILPSAFHGKEDLKFEHLLPQLHAETRGALKVSECRWFSTYRIHHRHAARLRDGHCFLLGDAAHVHSPVGAQGMNTGLQDAYNLAWKLALVVRGEARDTLLDSYEEERMPVAKRLLATTDRLFRLLVSDHPLAGFVRTRVLARVMSLAMRHPAIQRMAFKTLSQIAIHYRGRSLSQALAPLRAGPQPGDRFPWMELRVAGKQQPRDVLDALDDRRFNLVVVGQPAPSGLDMNILEIADHADNRGLLTRHGIPERAYYVIRPDGHIGTCGRDWDAEACHDYLASRVGLDLMAGRRLGPPPG